MHRKVKVRKLLGLILTAIFIFSTTHGVYAIGVNATIALGKSPNNVAYDSGRGEIFVANYWANMVYVISDVTNTVVATIPMIEPQGIAYDPAKGEIFVASYYNVSVISDSTNAIIANITVGGPCGLVYDSGKGEIFATNYDISTISVISDATNTVVANLNIYDYFHSVVYPDGLAYDPAKGEIFVADWDMAMVSVISDSTNAIVANVPVGYGPSDVAYDSSKGELFVAVQGLGAELPDELTSMVSVISDTTNTVVKNITVGMSPTGIAYDSGKGEIFVSNQDSSTVSIISDINNSVIATVPVGDHPEGIVYDSGKGEVFTANGGNSGNNSVSVVTDSSTLPAPCVSASPSTVDQGQTSILTSSAISTGTPPYKYQWFSGEPYTFNSQPSACYQPINGATSPSYRFVTSTSTFVGNWSFILSVTDSAGAAVSSTTIMVTVNAAGSSTSSSATPSPSTAPLSSATSTVTVTNNSATVDQSAITGINVTLNGPALQDGTQLNVTTTYYGENQPSEIASVSLSGAIAFYDVSVTSSSGALGRDVNATVSISNPSFTNSSIIQYWNGSIWTSVATAFTYPGTVSVTIPASALAGTPIVVGTPKLNTTSKLNLLEVIYGVVAGFAITATIVAVLMFTVRGKKNKGS